MVSESFGHLFVFDIECASRHVLRGCSKMYIQARLVKPWPYRGWTLRLFYFLSSMSFRLIAPLPLGRGLAWLADSCQPIM